jgi:hypothetical protein
MARLSIILNKAEARAGELVEARVMLDTQGASVNALEGSVAIPKGLDFVSLRDGASFVSVWIDRPVFRSGEVSFSGIVPGGYAGDIGPYWSGMRPGEVFTVVLRAKAEGSRAISVSLDHLLANDGAGTSLAVVPASASVSVRASTSTEAYSEQYSLDYDVTPPEPFEVVVADMPGAEGVRAAIFDTYDTGSGLAFFMVREGGGEFVPAESPHALSGQHRESIVVRAYDKAGNIREESLSVDPYPHAGGSASAAFWAILVMLLCIALFAFFRKRSS